MDVTKTPLGAAVHSELMAAALRLRDAQTGPEILAALERIAALHAVLVQVLKAEAIEDRR